ncbi:enterobactin transporter EntS [Nocardiopsis sp. CNT312]|uniref:enterobactin transporter EntS n=1 Tax=Nocardiopsis sp. CNT312 TaxID=1137268 RepID=UPI0004AD92FC|nr:enterobactin transporter EntS [Nocardiopsis sp. CNT312]
MKLSRMVIDTSPLCLSREFRIVFTARLISIFGLGFTTVALPLQVYGLTGSTLLVAAVQATISMSTLLGTLVGGILADRGDRRRLIVLGRSSAVLGFGVLALNTVLPEQPLLWVIFIVAAFNGGFGSLSAVALQAAAPGFVPRDRLPAAGALLALNGRLGSAFAPALGGALIALLGMGANYTVTCLLSLVTAVLVWRLPPLNPPAAATGDTVLADLWEGALFAVRHRVVGPLLLLGAVQMLFAAPIVLIPAFNDQVLGGDASVAGLLYTAPAVGALIGSLTSGWTSRVNRIGPPVLLAVALCGAASAALGLAAWIPVALAVFVVLGFGEVMEEILRYSLLQSHTPDRLRGRVNAVWTTQHTLGNSAGALTLGGVLAPLVGITGALFVGGGLTAACVGVLALCAPGLRTSRLRTEEPIAPAS